MSPASPQPQPQPRAEPPVEPLTIGASLLDRYRVVRRIAEGLHSVVYLGDDELLRRPVCIKVFRYSTAKPGVWRTSYEHFVQEAFALSRLTHPNTLRIYDFHRIPGTDEGGDGVPVQVSEYMSGGTLASLIRGGGPLELDEVARVVEALAGALSEAHHCGIIHRDIKPKNVLFADAGPSRLAKLADFGIAKTSERSDSADPWAQDTNIVGGKSLRMFSLAWASPEQMDGAAVGPASDVYSLSLVALYMLTGRVVFATKDVAEGRNLRAASDERIDTLCNLAGVPRPVVEVCKRGCALDVAGRISAADEFASELARAIRPNPARPQSAARAVEVARPLPLRPVLEDAVSLSPADPPDSFARRNIRFVRACDGVADIASAGGRVRLRATFIPIADGLCLHLRGLNCFPSPSALRPSVAVQVEQTMELSVLGADGQPLAQPIVSTGERTGGKTLFAVGASSVAISAAELPGVAMIDFGAGDDAVFIYPSRPRRTSKRTPTQ